MSIKVTTSSHNEKASCPYCKGEFHAHESLKTCDACQTSLHEECANELGRCTTIGCGQVFEIVVEQTITEGRESVHRFGMTELAAMSSEGQESGSFFQRLISKRVRYSSTALKFSVFLTLIWTMFLAYFIGVCVGQVESSVRKIIALVEFVILYGFLGTFLFVISTKVSIENSDNLDDKGAAWAFHVASRAMAVASFLALPAGAALDSSVFARIVFCVVALLAYLFFALRAMPSED